MTTYKVTQGIFQGLIFNGTQVTICGEPRIWNEDSIGQSFPVEHCEKL